MDNRQNTQLVLISKLLLKVVNKEEGLFYYQVAIQEAKKLLGLPTNSEFRDIVEDDLKELARV